MWRYGLRQLRPAVGIAVAGGTALACATGSCTHAAADDKPKQTLFSWGRLVPAPAGEEVKKVERSPFDVTFWSSQGLELKLVSFGVRHAAAVDSKGGLWAWSDAGGPTPRKLPCRSALTSLVSTDGALYALTSRGKVLQWSELGDSLGSEQPLPAEPKPMGGELGKISASSIAAGADHVLVIGSRGEVVGFGDNAHGQLGIGDRSLKRADQPVRLPQLPAEAAQAACGDGHSIVLLKDGRCVSFGDDRNLQLGVRKTTIRDLRQGLSCVHTPTVIEALKDKRVVAVRAGGGGIEGMRHLFHTTLRLRTRGVWPLTTRLQPAVPPRVGGTLRPTARARPVQAATRPFYLRTASCGHAATADGDSLVARPTPTSRRPSACRRSPDCGSGMMRCAAAVDPRASHPSHPSSRLTSSVACFRLPVYSSYPGTLP